MWEEESARQGVETDGQTEAVRNHAGKTMSGRKGSMQRQTREHTEADKGVCRGRQVSTQRETREHAEEDHAEGDKGARRGKYVTTQWQTREDIARYTEHTNSR